MVLSAALARAFADFAMAMSESLVKVSAETREANSAADCQLAPVVAVWPNWMAESSLMAEPASKRAARLGMNSAARKYPGTNL
jgi:hypothetical protein